MTASTTLSPVRYTAPCGMTAQSDHVSQATNTLWAFPLTRCCEATGKGDADSPTGVVCRVCYKTVDVAFAGSGWSALYAAAKDAKCPCPMQCADEALHRVLGA